jgi:aquaporin Z
MNKYIVEFIGTFFLVFTVGMVSIEPGAGALAPLAIGSALAVMVYAGGPISGAHYNPAVTLAVWLRGKVSGRDSIIYVVAQLLAAAAAALVVLYLKGNPELSAASPEVGPALVGEFLFAFALAFVILNVATAKRSEGNSYFGFAIGFTVMVGAYAVGPISGGAFNPAVALGITVMGLSEVASIWIFLVGPASGSSSWRICSAERPRPASSESSMGTGLRGLLALPPTAKRA